MKHFIFPALLLATAIAHPATDPITQCRNEHADNSSAQIECLEAALRARDGIPVEQKSDAAAGTHAAEAAATDASAVEAAAAGAAAVADEAPIQATKPAATGMGAEQVRDPGQQADGKKEKVLVRIIGTSYDARGIGTFRTEDGQVWRETMPSPERHRLAPDEQYSGRIERSLFGGYRLYVEGKRWMITVKRIE